MSALARYFKRTGKAVFGYDLVATELTRQLELEGIEITYRANVDAIEPSCKSKKQTLVVYTPAIPADMPILNWFKAEGFHLYKRSQVLGILTKERTGICVSGTHGKTTVSTMIGHLLTRSSVGCSAFLGGISKNYKTNLLVSTQSDYVVVEADEFDRSFHQLRPAMAVVTSVDADHLDIYGTKEALVESFKVFTSLIEGNGVLLVRNGLDFEPRVADGVKVYSYSLEASSDFYAENIRLENGLYTFDFVTPKETVKDLTLGIAGRINLENATAACSIAWLLGVNKAEMREGLESFKGIWRRFETHIQRSDLVYIDDYAHHPEEIKAALTSARELYPNQRLTVVFQPHLFTRTRDFAVEFAQSLDLADEVILLDIYPARELPIDGVTAQLVYEGLTTVDKILLSKTDLLGYLQNKKRDVVITLGAGDIGNMVGSIKDILETK